MDERRRLLTLLEVYDTAIEELYVLGDPGLLDLILRLERRSRDAAGRLAELDATSALSKEATAARTSTPTATRLHTISGSSDVHGSS
jgi:hypothetical protein